jgi:hypothetical protein
MKIAIFGDSFAKTLDYPEADQLGPAWWQLLSNDYSVTNYGLAGSAAYYSIEKFDEYHHYFDKVIFLMTFAGRVYLGKDNRITTEAYPRVIDSNFNTYDSAAANLKLLQSFDSYEKLDEIKIKAVMDYFLYVSNRDEELFKIERYKEYVKNTRPDSLVIDCMELFEISRLEFEHWNIPWDISINPTKDMKELRRCHFSDENNVVVYKMFKEWVETGNFNLDLNKVVKPKDSWEKYFVAETFKK